ncbi:MAG: Xaa-Pro aminopeptidase [Candidatus Cardinium sp.]|uniref:aminopeptidase P family protein n=1 Tax=Cardinium endosymbiont of Dermatophagoides farinae TaxID=2597823 RepID=UPI001182EAF9|nr:aminopeptidase P family protein [Cardinium endosymbiont of Dermatophagoides farinae]TSJ80888.1 M24 family metallopeptidase [Cardinium endosymbiont of Dermatophagoides farinae]UWW96899.1 MAG: Xaa-Pro aminopeptidase [Candidatus Cardinium sp.]
MRYQPIDPNLFIQNRKKLVAHLRPNSLVVLQANDLMPKNADGTMPFVQNSDLFYLSGIDQEETILLLYPDAPREEWKEILFIKETNAHLVIWEGHKYTKEVASSISGIATVHWTHQFNQIFHTLMGLVHQIYLGTNKHPRAHSPIATRERRFISWCQDHYPLHQYARVAPIMQQLRGIKDEIEIAFIQEACNITEAGFRSVIPMVRPGLMEYEIEALFSYAFLRRGSKGFAYAPIVASGANSCVLHYIHNDKPCPAGELLLVDVGAEYANYSADVTRVIPIDGKFTTRQRKVYNAVLRILKAAQALLRPGLSFASYHKAVGEWVEAELVALNLIDATAIKNQSKEVPAYRKYFMHGISHHLGLSTHDLGDTHGLILPNMVLTIEPGIYIKEEKIGIRLENNVVVRTDGVQNLTENIPIEAEAIEALMAKG